VCGSQSSKGDEYLFVARARSSVIQVLRVLPKLGVAHEKQAGDAANPSAAITAMATHPDRPWLVTALGAGQGHDSHTVYEGEIRIWDYGGMADDPKAFTNGALSKAARRGGGDNNDDGGFGCGGSGGSGGAGGAGSGESYDEEALKGRLQCLAVCRRGSDIPSSFGRLDVSSLAFGLGGQELLVAVGQEGLLLWSVAPATRHAARVAKATQALALAAASAGSSSSGRRASFTGRARALSSSAGAGGSSSSLVEAVPGPIAVGAIALQLFQDKAFSSSIQRLDSSNGSGGGDGGGGNGGVSGGGGDNLISDSSLLRVSFDPHAPLLHLLQHSSSTTTISNHHSSSSSSSHRPLIKKRCILSTLSLLPLHLAGPAKRNCLPLVARSVIFKGKTHSFSFPSSSPSSSQSNPLTATGQQQQQQQLPFLVAHPSVGRLVAVTQGGAGAM
jgi:hypothetical protein